MLQKIVDKHSKGYNWFFTYVNLFILFIFIYQEKRSLKEVNKGRECYQGQTEKGIGTCLKLKVLSSKLFKNFPWNNNGYFDWFWLKLFHLNFKLNSKIYIIFFWFPNIAPVSRQINSIQKLSFKKISFTLPSSQVFIPKNSLRQHSGG